jgi:hypothetical protein
MGSHARRVLVPSQRIGSRQQRSPGLIRPKPRLSVGQPTGGLWDYPHPAEMVPRRRGVVERVTECCVLRVLWRVL